MSLARRFSPVPPGRRRPLLDCLVAVALGCCCAQYLVSGAAVTWFSNTAWTAAAVFAVVATLGAVRESPDPDQRRRWSLLAAAATAWLGGQVAWDTYAAFGAAPGVPSAADVAWLLFAPLAIAGVHRLSSEEPRVRTLVVLDVGAMVTVAATIGVVAFYGRVTVSPLSTLGRTVAIAYSSLYAGVALALVQSMMRRIELRRHPELVVLLAGLVCIAAAFFWWTPELLARSYSPGTEPIDALWTVGILGMGVAARLASGRSPVPPRTERDLGRTVLMPCAGVVTLLALLPVLAVGAHPLGERLAVQIGVLISASALVARFWLLSRWHLSLVEEVSDLYNRAPCGYHSVDAEGLIVRINDTELGWLGYKRDEIVGRVRFPDLLTPASAERWRSVWASLREGSALRDVDFDIVRRDGTTMAVSLTTSVLRDDSGSFVRLRSTLFDITGRRRAGDALQELADELRRSNTDLEHFAYAASHDLAEPLRTITSFGQMLSRRYAEQLDEKAQRFLGHITDGAERMQRLIDSMLLYSRAGRAEPVRADVDCGALVEQVLASLGRSIAVEAAALQVGQLPRVSGSANQLAQVFQNLVANALKFVAPDRRPRVEITSARERGAWRFTVADNGIGIDPRHADRIFEMFQRLHARDEYEGTGIGLALCAKIVDRHGGRIWVESEPGAGSRFHFTIADPQETP